VFPITILPGWGQTVSKFLPVTYWMEGVRRGLEPQVVATLQGTTGLSEFSDIVLMLILIVSSVVFLFVSLAIFRVADHAARKRGKIDWTTAY